MSQKPGGQCSTAILKLVFFLHWLFVSGSHIGLEVRSKGPRTNSCESSIYASLSLRKRSSQAETARRSPMARVFGERFPYRHSSLEFLFCQGLRQRSFQPRFHLLMQDVLQKQVSPLRVPETFKPSLGTWRLLGILGACWECWVGRVYCTGRFLSTP